MTHCIDISNSHRPSVHQPATRFEPRGTHTPQVITNHQGDSTVHSHKERPKVMTKRHESTGSGDSFSEILAADRALDAIGRGELSAAQTDDPILALLADARGQSERSMPPAPDLATLLGDDWTDTTDPITHAVRIQCVSRVCGGKLVERGPGSESRSPPRRLRIGGR